MSQEGWEGLEQGEDERVENELVDKNNGSTLMTGSSGSRMNGNKSTMNGGDNSEGVRLRALDISVTEGLRVLK